VLTAFAGLLMAGNIWAQNEPVHNWVAPLYWQPSAREAALTERAVAARLGTQGMAPEDTSGSSTAPLVFVAVTPCRIMDTRGYDSTFVSGTPYGPPAMTAGSTRTVPVAGVTAGYCSLPATAQAVSVNVTLWPTPGTQVQWITLWPAGQAQPSVSTLNDYQGTMYNAANGITMYGINNAAIVPLGTGGAFDIYVTDATNLFIDVNGYYAAIGDTNGNTTLGIDALANNTGSGNTAVGNNALAANTTGSNNTAAGTEALNTNTTGDNNTAYGAAALESNTASYNTAIGANALLDNTTGTDNTATGALTLQNNTSGYANTASGELALQNNTTGNANTANGTWAMSANTTGVANTATGFSALSANTTGSEDTAVGLEALAGNTTGLNNTALGFQAGLNLTTGSNNIVLGGLAGSNLTTGDGNIDIGNAGNASDSNIIYLGTQGQQTTTYIAGISNATVSGSAVYVASNGQLGVQSSSRRYKQDIRDMGDTTDTLMSLRPVRFRYKTEGAAGPEHYGLIAEEVAEIAPELVGRRHDGQIDSVYYEKVNAMLLNEVQKQHRLIEEQQEQLQSQRQEFSERLQRQESLIRQLESRLAQVESRGR
jgi:hypothetical protein